MPHKPPFLPPALGLLVMLVIFSLHFIKPLGVVFPYPWNFIGLVPIALGALLNIAAERELNRAGASADPCEPSNVLVERGVYRLSRNPMAVGFILIAGGLAIWVGSVTPWLVVLLCPLMLYTLIIRREERQLEQHHGEAYRAYCQRVARWWGAPR